MNPTQAQNIAARALRITITRRERKHMAKFVGVARLRGMHYIDYIRYRCA